MNLGVSSSARNLILRLKTGPANKMQAGQNSKPHFVAESPWLMARLVKEIRLRGIG